MTANLNNPLPKIETLPEPNPAPKEQNFKKRGSKHEVYHGLALQTGGGLRKADLIQNKRGCIVSKKRSEQGAKQFKNIEKYIQEKKKHKQELEAAEDPHQVLEPEPLPKSEPPSKPIQLKPEAVQEEKEHPIKEEPPAKSESLSASHLPEIKPLERKKRGRKIKDEGALIDEIKHQ